MRSVRGTPSPPDFQLLNGLPCRHSLTLRADHCAPKAARGAIARILPEWSLAEFDVAASLIASELVTNSVVATCGMSWASAAPPVRVWLRGGPGLLAILAWDAVLTAPVPREATEDDESGRGLAIVTALSADRGFYYPERYGGKVTWAIVDTP
jgi:hypothetical protein